MKEILFFHKTGCPYCRQAEDILKELYIEKPEYLDIDIKRINESEDPETAEKYDYWYVPTMYVDGEKIYEADPSESRKQMKDEITNVLEKAIL
jgi:thioredoxin 1